MYKNTIMKKIIPNELQNRDLHQYLLAAVSPRPIALVSTLSKDGLPNLAPYSFFNCFSSNPPIVVFSSNRRVTDNTTKDTLNNIKTTRECVIHAVSYSMVRQMALTSVEFTPEVNEFEKAGFTPIAAERVKPYRVAESPIHMECTLREIVPLGEQVGAGHLIICDVVLLHINENLIDEKGRINPHELDLVGRLGRSFYVRASGEAVFPVVQEILKPVIGYDALPNHFKQCQVLSANNVAQLAGMEKLPDAAEIATLATTPHFAKALESVQPAAALRQLAKQLLDASDDRNQAAAALMLAAQLGA